MIRTRDNVEHYNWGADCDGWIMVDDPAISVIEERMPSNTSEIRHYHVHSRQFFRVLQGTLTMEMADETVELRSGDGIEIAPGIPHKACNRSPQDAVFLVISSPATSGDRVELT